MVEGGAAVSCMFVNLNAIIGIFCSMKLAITYAILSLFATAANIGAQELVVRSYSGAFHVLVSVAVGTAVGLVVKYVLDKRYIFCFRARDAAHDRRTFALYTLMGLLTTVIFWGFEFGFHQLFDNKGARYFGGVLGLAVGYFIKYQLDKRFVFRKGAA
jgi:putative flippase GtrA